jgi:hypothetical protein
LGFGTGIVNNFDVVNALVNGNGKYLIIISINNTDSSIGNKLAINWQ